MPGSGERLHPVPPVQSGARRSEYIGRAGQTDNRTGGRQSLSCHTFASWLIANGESLVYVKEQLGHHSIQITVDTYGHLIPGANRKAVNALDDPGWERA